MPSGRKRKHTCLELLCEWGECSDVFDNVDRFLDHVKIHIDQFIADTSVNVPPEATAAGMDVAAAEATLAVDCRWRLCPHFVDLRDVEGVERHVYFHAYHAKLKCRGLAALEEARSTGDGYNSSCILDSTSRNTIPELPERLRCHWGSCQYVRDNSELFYRHVNGHALDQPSGPKVEGGCACQWAGCEVVTANRYKLSEHLHSHTQERAAACPSCGGLFANSTKLIDHVRRQAMHSTQIYQCSHCNKDFPTERLLRDHIRHHVNMYKCPYCDMTCPHPSGLRTHVLYRHTEQGQFECPYCTYRAKAEGDLHKHVEIHNEAGTYSCPEPGCSYVTKTSEQYVRHFKTHCLPFPKRYACHVCQEVFIRGALLTVHLKEKHKFSWPSGHSRFRYKQDRDGMMRLQTVRFESIEGVDLSEQPHLLDDEELDEGAGAPVAPSEEGCGHADGAAVAAAAALSAERLPQPAVEEGHLISVRDQQATASKALPEEHLANLEMLHDVAVFRNLGTGSA